MNAKQGSCVDCLLAALGCEIIPVHLTPGIRMSFILEIHQSFFPSGWAGESFNSLCVPLSEVETLSVTELSIILTPIALSCLSCS